MKTYYFNELDALVVGIFVSANGIRKEEHQVYTNRRTNDSMG